jgi:hypothetical protein
MLTAKQLRRLRPGPAVVRATAVGGPQWMRRLPPTVRERAVRMVAVPMPSVRHALLVVQ